MAANELEVLLTAAMLLALPVIATYHWRDNRAVSWGALGLCLLIPEAASEHPNGALLHTIMAVTAVIVVLQLLIDALKQREQARGAQAATQPEAPADGRVDTPPAPEASPAQQPWAGGTTGLPRPFAHALYFLRRRHGEQGTSPARGSAWHEPRRGHQGQRP